MGQITSCAQSVEDCLNSLILRVELLELSIFTIRGAKLEHT